MIPDPELLREYAENRSEEAFAELVRRHLGLVYRVALRKANGDTHLAEEVTQGVFTDLARKAGGLCRREMLAGWLFTSTHFAATKAVRSEQRRRNREQKARIMDESFSEAASVTDWDRLRPLLDDLIHDLPEADREALLLRFFEERDYEQMGTTLRLSPNGARSRVERALDKIRVSLAGRGITSTAVALATAFEGESLAAVPAGLASTVTTAAIASAAGGAGTVAVVGFFMNKTLLIGAVAMIAIGFATYQTKQNQRLEAALVDVSQDRDGLRSKLQDEQQHAAAAEREMETLKRELANTTDKNARNPASEKPASPTMVTASPEERAKLHQRYDPFLLRFGLTPKQMERFVDLNLAIAAAQHDLQVAVEENGVPGDTPDIEVLRYKATAPMWDEIHQLLGPDGSAAYEDYERMSAYRPAMVEIFHEARVAISDAQTDQLTRLALKNLQTYHKKPTDISTPVRIDWNAVARDAESFLAPEQLGVIRKKTE